MSNPIDDNRLPCFEPTDPGWIGESEMVIRITEGGLDYINDPNKTYPLDILIRKISSDRRATLREMLDIKGGDHRSIIEALEALPALKKVQGPVRATLYLPEDFH